MNPGIYDITIEDYHASEGISRSSLIEFQKSAYHFWYKKNNPEKRESVDIIRKTNALEFGNALHCYVLENDSFIERYYVMDKINRTTKAGKTAYMEALETADGRVLICSEAMREIRKISNSINIHGDAKALISDALYEKSIYWTDPDSEMLCKIRPDVWHENFVCDLKTCVSASAKDFQRSILNYGYHIQAGMIHEGIKHATGKIINNFIYIAVEKEAPYAVAVYQLDSDALEFGIKQFKRLIKDVKKCMDENVWPCYPTEIISLPQYAFNKEEN